MRHAAPLQRLIPVVAASLWLAACQQKPAENTAARRPPPEVGVVTVQTSDAPLEVALPGRLSASQTAEVRPQVSGLVLKRLYTEGAWVSAGQPMYQLDPASFEVERQRSAAALQKAEAQLAAARTKAARDAELLKADTISRQVADDSAAAARQAEADVAVARAALDAAKLQLARTKVTAPIDGLAEASTVSAGALVTASQTAALTTIRRTDPMHVDIVQNSAEMLQLRRRMGAGTEGPRAASAPSAGAPPAAPGASTPPRAATPAPGTAAAAPGRPASGPAGGKPRTLKLQLEDGSTYPLPATLQFSSVSVDTGTGAVTLRATVPNPRGVLLPGMVVTAKLVVAMDKDAVLVPQQGVSRSPTGEATALVVGADNKAELRRLTLERAVGNRWLVAKGLAAGDKLIVEGLQRVRAGQAVTPVPAGSRAGKGGGKAGMGGGGAGAGSPGGGASAVAASALASAPAVPASAPASAASR